jgi:hypothetical protein
VVAFASKLIAETCFSISKIHSHLKYILLSQRKACGLSRSTAQIMVMRMHATS